MGKKAPKQPDPRETAAASTSTNVGTAIANAYLGNVNQVTPDGTLSYNQTGSYEWNDPFTDKTYNVPTFTATQTLSDQQKAIKSQTDDAELNLATLGNRLSGTLGQQLTGNFKLGNEATEARLFDLGRQRLDPMFAEQQSALASKLANQGISVGSKAYDTAQRQQYQSQNDAYNQLLLSGRGQASQELMAEDNQRINQISALLNGGQVSQPNFVNANTSTIPTTDTAGIIQQDYQNRLGAYQQKQAGMGAALGGLFSLGNSFLMSDRRLKTDIQRVGAADNGLPIYLYRYKAGGPFMLGFMADEVEAVHPKAVAEIDGFKAVDYSKAVL